MKAGTKEMYQWRKSATLDERIAHEPSKREFLTALYTLRERGMLREPHLIEARCGESWSWLARACGQPHRMKRKVARECVLALMTGRVAPSAKSVVSAAKVRRVAKLERARSEARKTAPAPASDAWKARAPGPASDAFLASYEWRRVRMEALKLHGARCQCCGASPQQGVVIHVDHIKPRRLFPQLALDVSNLQVLCEVCNHGKGNWDMTDWRPTDDGGACDQLAAESAARLAYLLEKED